MDAGLTTACLPAAAPAIYASVSLTTISLRRHPDRGRKQLQPVADDLAVGRAGRGGHLERHALRLDPKPRAGKDGGRAAREAIGEQDRATENKREAPLFRRQEADGRIEPRRVRPSGVARVNRERDEGPLSMGDADERELQQQPETLLRPKVGRMAPREVGERADRDAQAPVRRDLAREGGRPSRS